jgi:hypothetical protein
LRNPSNNLKKGDITSASAQTGGGKLKMLSTNVTVSRPISASNANGSKSLIGGSNDYGDITKQALQPKEFTVLEMQLDPKKQRISSSNVRTPSNGQGNSLFNKNQTSAKSLKKLPNAPGKLQRPPSGRIKIQCDPDGINLKNKKTTEV